MRLYHGKSVHVALTRWDNPAGGLYMPRLQRYLHISVRREHQPRRWRITVPLRRHKGGRQSLLLRVTVYTGKPALKLADRNETQTTLADEAKLRVPLERVE